MHEAKPVKRKIVFAVLLVIAILVIPIPISPMRDGGSREYRALTYKIVDWHRAYGGKTLDTTEVYFFPDNLKSIDELFDEEIRKRNA